MKVRPDLLEKYELEPAQQAQFPMDWASLFGRKAPLAVEIGFGNGEYLDWWAGNHPDWDFVGIELPQDCVLRAAPKFEINSRENIRLLRGDARYLLRELFAPASLKHVLMQFPMPWSKSKHAKHRVYSPQFSATLADVVEVGGHFELVTDQEWYAQETAEVLGGSGNFEILTLESNPDRPFRTRYEEKWLEDQRSIHRVLARIQSPVSAPRLLLPEPMQIVHLANQPAAEKVQALEGKRFTQATEVVEVKEVFQAKNGWFLYVVTSDDSFSQHCYLRVQFKDDGRVLLRIHGRPRPYHTPAVRFALRELGRQLS